MTIDPHAWLDTALEAAILWILIKEFNFDKIAYEKEQYKKRTKRTKSKEGKGLDTPQISSGSNKKDVAVEPSKAGSSKVSPSQTKDLGMCPLCDDIYCNPVYHQKRPDPKEDAGSR